jgi:hypothetical protein
VLEGLEGMRPDLEATSAGVEAGQERAADLTHRAHLLAVNHRYAQKLLELQREWLAEAEEVLGSKEERSSAGAAPLSGGSSRSSRSPS